MKSLEKTAGFRRKLTDAFIRNISEPGRYADGEVPGLYLEVRQSLRTGRSTSKHWRLKYRLRGKENRFSIGSYPEVSLKSARERGLEARRNVANNIAPLKAKTDKLEAQAQAETRTFEYVAEQWLQYKLNRP